MSDITFHGYPSIENSYQKGFIDKIKERGYGNIQYMVSEKIHGANTQLTYRFDDGIFKIGGRTKFLQEDESFYNAQTVIERFEPQLRIIAEFLRKKLSIYGLNATSVSMFGELFGGSYPHNDVPLDKTAHRVQKGVFYSPHNEWLAFDIGYTLAGSDKMIFFSGSEFFDCCYFAGIPMVPIIKVASNLDDALTVKNDGASQVYLRYHLPKIDDNIMEGVVIRPYYQDIWFGDTRLIIKNKNEKFKEKSRMKKLDVPKEVPEVVKKAQEEISQYINLNRVHAVLSKLGEADAKDIGKVIMMVSQDILQEYQKEYDTFKNIEKKDEKMVTKFMNSEVAKLVRDVIIFGK